MMLNQFLWNAALHINVLIVVLFRRRNDLLRLILGAFRGGNKL